MNLVRVAGRGFNLDQLVEWREGEKQLTLIFAEREGGTKVFLFNDDAQLLRDYLVKSSVDLQYEALHAGIIAGTTFASDAYAKGEEPAYARCVDEAVSKPAGKEQS